MAQTMTSQAERTEPQDAAYLLKLWMLQTNTSLKSLAHDLGCTVGQVSRWRQRKRKPRGQLLVNLERVTGIAGWRWYES